MTSNRSKRYLVNINHCAHNMRTFRYWIIIHIITSLHEGSYTVTVIDEISSNHGRNCVFLTANALKKVWIHIYSPLAQLWVNIRTDCVSFCLVTTTSFEKGKLWIQINFYSLILWRGFAVGLEIDCWSSSFSMSTTRLNSFLLDRLPYQS